MKNSPYVVATALLLVAPWMAISCAVSSGKSDTGNDDDDGGQGGAGGNQMVVSSSSSSSSGQGGAGGVGGAGGEGGAEDLCGNNQLDPGEQCDGTQFGDATCESVGFGGGTLKCNSFCNIVVSSCTPKENCNNGFDDDSDFLIDCEDDDCDTALQCTDSCASPKFASPPFFDFPTTIGRPDLLENSCGNGTSGPELVYEVTPNFTGVLTISASCNADCSLAVRTECDNASTEDYCIDDNAGTFSNESLDVPVTDGVKFFLVIDGVNDSDADYLSLQMANEICTDFFDNDGDMFMDCEDSGCSSDPGCVPGTDATSDACTAHTECSSNANDDPFCIDDFFWGWPNGYCSEFCDLGADDCASGSVCGDPMITFSGNGLCLKTCANAADCPNGYTCSDTYSTGTDACHI